MFANFLILMLSAAGMLLIIWCLFGFLLHQSGEDDLILHCLHGNAAELESYLRWIGWLRQSGLLASEVVLVDCGLSERGRQLALCAIERNNFVTDLISTED